MRKKDRTPEERTFDTLLKSGIMRLSQAAEPPAPPNAFPHVFVHDKMGRKGHRCRILRNSGALAQIEFEDGFTAKVGRRALRRSKE